MIQKGRHLSFPFFISKEHLVNINVLFFIQIIAGINARKDNFASKNVYSVYQLPK